MSLLRLVQPRSFAATLARTSVPIPRPLISSNPIFVRWKSNKSADRKKNAPSSSHEVDNGDGEGFNAQVYKLQMDKALEALQKSFADIKTSRTDPRTSFLFEHFLIIITFC
jgi:hypothetical protein